MDFKPGDEILTTTQDYPRMLTTLRQREMREGLKLNLIKIPIAPNKVDDIASAFERAVTTKTKLILISHQINLTGQITPVKKVCEMARSRGVETIVDGAHSFAQFDFKRDDLGCDYFGTSLHKWLLAPIGTGLLYIRSEKIANVWPLFGAPPEMKTRMAKFMRWGTFSPAPVLAISDALAFQNAIGGKRKEERLRYLTRYWATRLQKLSNVRFLTSFRSPEMSCGIATMQLQGIDSNALQRHLHERRSILVQSVASRWAPEIHGIRVTPNLYTRLDELDRFCEVIEEIVAKGLPS